MATKSPNTTPTTIPNTPNPMNSNKAQSTHEGQDREEALASATSARSKKRSAPKVVDVRSSAPKKQPDCAVVEEAADDPYRSNKKKRSSDNVVVDANNNGQCDEDTDGQRNSVAVASSSSSLPSTFDQRLITSSSRSSSSSSSSSSKVIVFDAPEGVNVKNSLLEQILAKKSNPHGIVDMKSKNFDFGVIVEKCQRNAVDYHEVDDQKRPFMKYYAWKSKNGEHIMSLPPKTAKGLAEFRKLDSLSKNIFLTSSGLQKRMENAARNGEELDGFSVELRNEILWVDEVGFPNDEALSRGRQLAREYKDRVLGHFSELFPVSVGMSTSQRTLLSNGTRSVCAILNALVEYECEYINAFITVICKCKEDTDRSSLTGPNVFRAKNQGHASAKMNVVARAMVQTGNVNKRRVQLLKCGGAVKDVWIFNLKRKLASGKSPSRKLGVFRVDPKTNAQHAIGKAEQMKVGREFAILNMIVAKCVTFKDIDEQRDCLRDMFDAAHKKDTAFWVRALGRLMVGREIPAGPSATVLEFLYGKELMGEPVAWLLG